MCTNLVDASLDIFLVTGSIYDGGVVLVNDDGLGLTKVVQCEVFELHAHIFRNNLASGQDGNVFQHGLAAIAKARSLDGSTLQCSTNLVDDQGG